MENIFRIAFWTIALSGTLRAGAACIRSDIAAPDGDIQQVDCLADMILYAPAPNVDCLEAALGCVIAELKTAKLECKDPGHEIIKIEEQLNYNKKDLKTFKIPPQFNATVCACEAAPRLPWKEFLDNMTKLLQMYGTYCPN